MATPQAWINKTGLQDCQGKDDPANSLVFQSRLLAGFMTEIGGKKVDKERMQMCLGSFPA